MYGGGLKGNVQRGIGKAGALSGMRKKTLQQFRLTTGQCANAHAQHFDGAICLPGKLLFGGCQQRAA